MCALNHRLVDSGLQAYVLGDEFCVDNVVVVKQTRRGIVAVTCNEPKLRSFGVSVDGPCWERVFGVLVSMIKCENARDSILTGNPDAVPGFEVAKVREDTRTSVGCIDMSEKDGGAALARRRGPVVPPSWSARTVRRHFQRPVPLKSET